ncbi:hypothetical protein ACHAWF_005551 [Thalassiosira exigua]
MATRRTGARTGTKTKTLAVAAAAVLFVLASGLARDARNVRALLALASIGTDEGGVVRPAVAEEVDPDAPPATAEGFGVGAVGHGVGRPPPVDSRAASRAMSREAEAGKDGDVVVPAVGDCLRARNDTVPPSLYRKLPKPYINLGFPKMGTSSLYAYFDCGGLTATHFKCGKKANGQNSRKCAVCTRESVAAGLPPLSQCGVADVYAQIDNGTYFPQIELLEELVSGHPDATFFLTFRSMEKWYHSITHWPPRKNGPHMDERFLKLNITGSPYYEGGHKRPSNQQEFSDWYCRHVERVREAVANHPSHALVEVDIEDPDAGRRMEELFGIDASCWGRSNVNANIHKNAPEVEFSKHFRRKAGKDPKSDADDDERSDRSDAASEDADGPESDGSGADAREGSGDDDGEDGADGSSRSRDIPLCLRARSDTIPASLHGTLSPPYVNLGFPKMGTTSLHSFFECGGLKSRHFRCRRDAKCSTCTRESVAAGLPPLAQCGKADAFMQIDDGVYFPQIELLEELVSGHRNGTFFLTFRSMEKWYHSITHWPPRKRGPHMDERFLKLNITGSPSYEGGKKRPSFQWEFRDWYCRHVERVRETVARHRSTLVEVDIEDPGIGRRMADLFGIDASCWGHTNMNLNIHADVNVSDVEVSKIFRKKAADDPGDRTKVGRREKGKKDQSQDEPGDEPDEGATKGRRAQRKDKGKKDQRHSPIPW